MQRAGHTPYVLVGGATGMIGDPKESSERILNDAVTVKDWTERVRRQIEPFLSFEGDNAATMVNNYDWTENLSTIDFLRDIGKHFPVNRMLARDVVRSRLEAGISYTEFSYVLLQSMDFLNLFREHGVVLQFGGSDQWGNLTGGVELIRRADGGQAHAFATPLITKADGTKYGKTEGGALWLDAEMMSPYAFYQFWLNQGDSEVGQLLRVFTFLPREEIEALEVEHAEKPFLRTAQRTLAAHVTTLVHGAEETQRIEEASEALFSGGSLAAADPDVLSQALATARPLVTRRGWHDAHRPVRRLRAGAEPQRGAPCVRRGRRVRQQRAGGRPRLRPDRSRLPGRQGAGPAAGQEELRRSNDRLSTWLSGLEERARATLPAPVFEYLAPGARDAVSTFEGRGWSECRFLPHVLRDVTEVDLSATTARHDGPGSVGRRARPHSSGRSTPTASWRWPKRRQPPGRSWSSPATPAQRSPTSPPLACAGGSRPTCLRTEPSPSHCSPARSTPVPRRSCSRSTPRWSGRSTPPATRWSGTSIDPDLLRVNFDPGHDDLPGAEKATDLGPHDLGWLAEETDLPVVAKGVLPRRRRPPLRPGRRRGDLGLQPRWPPARPGSEHRVRLPGWWRRSRVPQVYVDGGIRSGLDVARGPGDGRRRSVPRPAAALRPRRGRGRCGRMHRDLRRGDRGSLPAGRLPVRRRHSRNRRPT